MSEQLTQERGNLRPYADYSLERKAEVLALITANNGNIDQTARETGIPHQTIRHWYANRERFSHLESKKIVQLADECESDARYYFSLARDKAPDAPFNHLMTGAAIAVDKMLLLRGQPTSITASYERQELTVLLDTSLELDLPK